MLFSILLLSSSIATIESFKIYFLIKLFKSKNETKKIKIIKKIYKDDDEDESLNKKLKIPELDSFDR